MINEPEQDASGILASKSTPVQPISFQMSLLGYKLVGKNWEPAEICLVIFHSAEDKTNLCCGALGNKALDDHDSGQKLNINSLSPKAGRLSVIEGLRALRNKFDLEASFSSIMM